MAVDLLFLYRTPKKRRYFKRLATEALSDLDTLVLSYRSLPWGLGSVMGPGQLNTVVARAEREWFNARHSRRARCLQMIARPFLRFFVAHQYRRLHHLLSSTRPDMIAIWNGHKIHDLVLHAVNEEFNIPLAWFENGVLPGTTTLDFEGVNANNSVPRDPEVLRRFAGTPRRERELVGRAYRRSTGTTNELPERYVLVPFQLDRDSQILDNSTWIKSMRELYAVVVTALERSDDAGLHLVFRPHPSARSQYPDLHADAAGHPRVHFDAATPLADAIERSRAVITVNSSVGLEALMLDKTVLVLGDAFYALPGLVLMPDSAEELVAVLNTLEDFRPDAELGQGLLNYLDQEYVIEGRWQVADDDHLCAISYRLRQKGREFTRPIHGSSVRLL